MASRSLIGLPAPCFPSGVPAGLVLRSYGVGGSQVHQRTASPRVEQGRGMVMRWAQRGCWHRKRKRRNPRRVSAGTRRENGGAAGLPCFCFFPLLSLGSVYFYRSLSLPVTMGGDACTQRSLDLCSCSHVFVSFVLSLSGAFASRLRYRFARYRLPQGGRRTARDSGRVSIATDLGARATLARLLLFRSGGQRAWSEVEKEREKKEVAVVEPPPGGTVASAGIWGPRRSRDARSGSRGLSFCVFPQFVAFKPLRRQIRT